MVPKRGDKNGSQSQTFLPGSARPDAQAPPTLLRKLPCSLTFAAPPVSDALPDFRVTSSLPLGCGPFPDHPIRNCDSTPRSIPALFSFPPEHTPRFSASPVTSGMEALRGQGVARAWLPSPASCSQCSIQHV